MAAKVVFNQQDIFYDCTIAPHLYGFYSHNIYFEGLLFSSVSRLVAGTKFFRHPRGARNAIVVVVVVIAMLYISVRI